MAPSGCGLGLKKSVMAGPSAASASPLSAPNAAFTALSSSATLDQLDELALERGSLARDSARLTAAERSFAAFGSAKTSPRIPAGT